MAKYTVELYRLAEDTNFKLFDFEYNLYNNELKAEFEKFFVDYFYFNEIGFETIGRFKKALQNKLNTIYPYYEEYYKSCIALKERDMMQTKEVIEEMTREVKGKTKTDSNSTSKSDTNHTNIFSATPKQSIENIEKYMTQATKDNNQLNDTNNTEVNGENEQIEKTSFTSKGNLGVSSDGFLIEKWREIIVDINTKICQDELSELFMLLY